MGGPWENYASADTDSDASSGPWQKYQSDEENPFDISKGPTGQILGAVRTGVNNVDSVTGAPIRAAVAAAQTADQPFNILPDAMNAYGNQFGKDNSTAPTGDDLAANAGATRGSMGAKLAGVGLDMATNPIGLLPIGEIIGAGAEATGLGGKAAEFASEATPAATNAAEAPGAIAKIGGKIGETTTGVDRKLVANYIQNTDRINALADQYKTAEGGYAEADHANGLRDIWRSVIQNTRQKMNGQISAGLDGDAGKQTVSAASMNDQIDAAIAKADPATQKEDIATLQNLKSTLGEMTDPGGNISLKRLQAFKIYSAKVGDGAYDALGNQIFPGGDFAASQAKNVAGTARQALIDNAPDSVSKAQSTLSDLHNAEDTMNSTILKDNGPVHAIARAGVNQGGIEARSLGQLGDITGYNFSQDAKDFATTREFASPQYTPKDSTGKSLLRSGITGGFGALAGGIGSHVLGLPDTIAGGMTVAGYQGGKMLASPAALKAGVNAANSVGGVVSNFAKGAANVAKYGTSAAAGLAASPAGKIAVDIGAKGALVPGAGSIPVVAQQPKGEDLWAQQGIKKLGIQDPAFAGKLFSDPKAKQLLIQASDLAPNSKAMNAIMAQIKKGWGQS